LKRLTALRTGRLNFIGSAMWSSWTSGKGSFYLSLPRNLSKCSTGDTNSNLAALAATPSMLNQNGAAVPLYIDILRELQNIAPLS
jgi:hypothetical protein